MTLRAIMILLSVVSLYQGWTFYNNIFGFTSGIILVCVFEATRFVSIWGIIKKKNLVYSWSLYLIVAFICAGAALNSYVIEHQQEKQKNIELNEHRNREIKEIEVQEKVRLASILSKKYDDSIDNERKLIDQCNILLTKYPSRRDYYDERIRQHGDEVTRLTLERDNIVEKLSPENLAVITGEMLSSEYVTRKKSITDTPSRKLSKFWGIDEDLSVIVIGLLLTLVVELGIISSGVMSAGKQTRVEKKVIPTKSQSISVQKKDKVKDEGLDEKMRRFKRIVIENGGVVPNASQVTVGLREARKKYLEELK